MRVSACQCCGESINAGTRGPVPTKCGPCLGRRRPGGPPLPKKVRPKKPPEERIRSDRFTFVPGRIRSECGHCGKTLWLFPKTFAKQQRHFCGRECRGLADRRAVPHRYQCVRCGKQCSMQGNPRQKQKGLYCSRKCAAETRASKAAASRVHLDLSDWFTGWAKQHIISRDCPQCGKAFRCAATSKRRKCAPCARGLPQRTKCIECGQPRQDGRRRCRACWTLRQKRLHQEHGNHRKRCRKYGVPYDGFVNRFSVCERDGWICQICGVKTKKVANTKCPHPHEATLDHITPLARGTKGHEWDNVQCACRSCNCYVKRDKAIHCQRRLL